MQSNCDPCSTWRKRLAQLERDGTAWRKEKNYAERY